MNQKYLTPNLATLVKLGSIAVHVDEMMSPGAHEFDRISIKSLLDDPEVKAWMAEMDKQGFLPKKRS